jgi:hypothetical protein
MPMRGPKKQRAYWLPPSKQKEVTSETKGRLLFQGHTLAWGVTLEQAKERFPQYQVVRQRRAEDALNKRLPGSYGKRQ